VSTDTAFFLGSAKDGMLNLAIPSRSSSQRKLGSSAFAGHVKDEGTGFQLSLE
jgi:hypothetical protein